MTATFNPDLSDDISLVRFHIGDANVNDNPYLEDETITALLTSEESVGGAVVASIKHIIALLSVPNFKKDWLSVDADAARKGYVELLAIKRAEFGIQDVVVETTIALPYRADNDQDSSVATYADDRLEDGSGDI